jgi:hypothetical protein
MTININFEKRKCCKCGSNKTGKNLSGNPHWYKYYAEKGNWDGESHICTICYQKYGFKGSHNTQRFVSNYRTGNVKKDDDYGISIISQAVVVKVHRIEDLTIKTDNLRYYIDAESDKYGKIDIKSSTLQQYGIYDFKNRMKIDCDTYICLGYDKYRRNVDDVYIVPNEGWIYELGHIAIPKNPSRTSKYDKFKVYSKPYNDTYHDLMSFLKDRTYFGIEDIKKWLETSYKMLT